MFATGRVMLQLDEDKLKDTIKKTEKVYVIIIKKRTSYKPTDITSKDIFDEADLKVENVISLFVNLKYTLLNPDELNKLI